MSFEFRKSNCKLVHTQVHKGFWRTINRMAKEAGVPKYEVLNGLLAKSIKRTTKKAK